MHVRKVQKLSDFQMSATLFSTSLSVDDSLFKIGMDFELSDLEVEEEVMMELEGYYEEEMQGDLLDRLVAQNPMSLSNSSNYSYRPAPFSAMDLEEEQNQGMGISGSGSLFSGSTEPNTTKTNPEPAPQQEKKVVRKCTCKKTRCLKNYCQCFRLGLVCTEDCECVNCCNQEPLFLMRSDAQELRCKCQKSRCVKGYCECFSAGRKCGSSCTCVDCENKVVRNELYDRPIEQPNYGFMAVDSFISFNQ